MKTLMRVGLMILAMAMGLSSVRADAPDTFRFRLPADPQTLDWTRARTNYETYAIMNIMEGLVEIGPSLEPVPRLADHWTVSEDGRTYTFALKSNVRWSDGVVLSSRDFVTSWRRLLEPGNKNEYASFLFGVENAEEYHRGKIRDFAKVGVKTLGPLALEVRLKRPLPYFLSLLSFWVTFPQRDDLLKKKGWDQPPKLVVLGPYVPTRWEKGKEIVFARNPSYNGEAPKVERIVAKIEPDAARARKLFADDKIDALLNVSTEDLVGFSASGAAAGQTLKRFDYLATVFLAFNLNPASAPKNAQSARKVRATSSTLINSELRRAIGLALDRSGIPAALSGGQVPADSLMPKGLDAYDPGSGIDADADQAKRALLAAGYSSGGEVPPLSILCIEGALTHAAEYVRDKLHSTLGLNVLIRSVTPGEYVRARKAGDFQMLIAQWGLDYPDASSLFELFLSDTDSNYTGWKNTRYDTLVKNAGGSLKILDRLTAYSEAQRLLVQDSRVVVPLFYPKITALLGPHVRELEINPLNYFFFKRLVLRQ